MYHLGKEQNSYLVADWNENEKIQLVGLVLISEWFLYL